MEIALADLRKSLRNRATSLGLPAFWQWWLAQLAPLVPALPKNAVHRRRMRPVLAFEDGAAVLWDVRAVNGAIAHVSTARIPLAGDAAAVALAGRAAIESLPRASGAPTSAPRVVIALPRQQVLRRQLTLPAALEENLRDALTYDLDRLTPFRSDQLFFDAVVSGRDVAKKEIRVDWAAALRTNVEQARHHAESWGASVVAVTPDMLNADVSPQTVRWSKLNLLPEQDRPDRPIWRRWQFLVPLGALALVALIVVVLPIWQKRDYVIALAQTTEQARVQAAVSDSLRQQLDQAVGDYNFALERKYSFPSMVQLLDDVTRLLPDDTWLTQLEVKSTPKGKEPHREIVLRGESGNAGNLVAKLEDSKLFEQAAPRSPTTKIQPGPGEVFDLGANLRSMPPPQPERLARAAPPPPAAVAAPAAPAPAAAAPASAATAAPASTAATPSGAPAAPAPAAAPSAAAPGAVPAPATASVPPPAGPANAGGGRSILQRVSPAQAVPAAEAAPADGAQAEDANAADADGANPPESEATAEAAEPTPPPAPQRRRSSRSSRRGAAQ